MGGVVERDRRAARRTTRSATACSASSMRLVALDVVQLLAAALVDQLEMAVDAKADDRGSEHAVVEHHVLDKAHSGGRHAGRRREQRNDGAARRIAADQQPRQQIVKQHERRRRSRRRAAPGRPAAWRRAAASSVGSITTPLGKPTATVSPLATGIGLCGAEHDAAGLLLDDAGVLAARALRPGVERALLERDLVRQIDARFGDVDRKGPAGAGGVPVKLVEAVEEADLPRGAVADDVGVRAGVDGAAGAADAHAHAVRHLLGGEILGGAVARHRLDVEADLDARAVGAVIDGRESRAGCRA